MFSNANISLDSRAENPGPSLEWSGWLDEMVLLGYFLAMNPTRNKCVSFCFIVVCAWLLPAAAPKEKAALPEPKASPPKYGWNAEDLDRKLKIIRVAELNFFEVSLPDALNALQAISIERDPEAKANPKFAGVQFVLLTREKPPPKITLQLRNVRLGSILDLLVELIGYDYQVRDAAIVVFKPKPRPAKKQVFRQLETEFFELNEDMVRRMGGR